MMRTPKQIPKFESEEDELEFWDTHDWDDFDDGPAEDIILAIRPEKKKSVTLRLEPSLVAELKRMARRHHIPYQTLMRGLVKRGLRDLRKAG